MPTTTHSSLQERLTTQDVEKYLEIGKNSFYQLIQAASREPTQARHSDRRMSNCVARTKIHGTLSEVRDIFESNDSIMASYMNLESTLLLTSLSAQARLRWTLLVSKLSPVIRHRDLCYVEYMDNFTTNDGRHGFARALRSVDLPFGPAIDGCIRAQIYSSGYVFIESEVPGILDATLMLSLAFGGMVPRWIGHSAMHSRVQHIQNLNNLLQDRRQLQLRQSQRNKCQRCSKSAHGRGKFRGQTCIACFQLFCDDCIPSESQTCIGCSLNVYSPNSHTRESIFDGTAFRGHGRSVDMTMHVDEDISPSTSPLIGTARVR